MKKILAVYDTDEEYGSRLSDYFARKEALPFTMHYFSKLEALLQFAQETPIDLLLLHKEEHDARIDEVHAKQILYLSEQLEESGKESCIYKYQSSDHLLRDLMACYEAMDGERRAVLQALRKVSVIGVYSPVGRCLKTSFALTLGQVLAQNKRVLYLNLEEFAGFDALFGRHFTKDFSDLLYCYSQKTLKSQLPELIETWHSLDFIPPVQYPEDLEAFTSGELVQVLSTLAESLSYDVLLLDLGTTLHYARNLFDICNWIYMPVREDAVSRSKQDAFDSWLELMKNPELAGRIVRVKLPYHQNFGQKEMYLEHLLWGELGDFVRSLVVERRQEESECWNKSEIR